MAGYTRVNLVRDVDDVAPRFGHSPDLESRFARNALGMAFGAPNTENKDTELARDFWE